MFYRIEDRMATELKLGGNELLVYGVIYSSQNQTYTRGQETLARYVGSKRITVVRVLQKLLDNRLIEKVSKGYKIVSNGYIKVSKGYIEENKEMYQNDTQMYQNDTINVSKGYTYNKQEITENNKKEIKEKSSTSGQRVKKADTDTPSVENILAQFIEHTGIKNEQALASIKTWLEYKQGSKHKYKSITGAITQLQKVLGLLGEKDRVKKLEFCVNNSIANNWQGLGWYDSSEREFYAWLKQEQKIKKEEETPIQGGQGYGIETIDSIINNLVEEQIKQGIITKL